MVAHTSQPAPPPAPPGMLNARAKHLRSAGQEPPRTIRSQKSRLRWRQRVHALVANLTDKRTRAEWAFALQISPGRTENWSCERLADGPTVTVDAVIHLPKEIRDEFLRTLAEWGDLNDRGEM